MPETDRCRSFVLKHTWNFSCYFQVTLLTTNIVLEFCTLSVRKQCIYIYRHQLREIQRWFICSVNSPGTPLKYECAHATLHKRDLFNSLSHTRARHVSLVRFIPQTACRRTQVCHFFSRERHRDRTEAARPTLQRLPPMIMSPKLAQYQHARPV